MRAWHVEAPGLVTGQPLRLSTEDAVPEPGPGELLLKVLACGVCRTDLHVTEGDLPVHQPGVIPGHEVVTEVVALGEGAGTADANPLGFKPGDRAGAAWLRWTDQRCKFCLRDAENLCPNSLYTGWDANGGYAEYLTVPAAYAHRLPEGYSDLELAPLLCAGIIGYHALQRAELPPGGRLGLYGFGGSAHLAAQVALARGATVHVLTRGEQAKQLARELGAASVGDAADMPPEPLDSAILFAPVGDLVLPALAALDRGGTLAIAGIALTDIPPLNYQKHLFQERQLRSVTSNTRADAREFLGLAAEHKLAVTVHPYPLDAADQALRDLKAGRFDGAAVLTPALRITGILASQGAAMSKQAKPPPPGDKPTGSAPPPPPTWRNWLWPITILIILALFFLLPTRGRSTSLTYSQFISDVQQHKVKSVELSGSVGGTSSGTLTDGTNFTVVIPPQAGQDALNQLTANVPEVSTAPAGSGIGAEILIYLIVFGLPLLLSIWLFRRISRGAAGQLGGVLGAGRSRAKIFDEERPSTTFADVAGYEGAKAEIAEVVDFLRSPERYTRVGALVPRGVLMVGPPGTGKTLLARAVAGEAKVPFMSVTGSSFVELFVGVGAARVRDLFAEARKRAPVIIFIDEIDAIGQRRAGSGAVVSNDEREQTLNQLLAEMDGFEPSSGVVVLAATNRPEVLDPALLRPGRFDRQVTIPLPNVSERTAILGVHVRGKMIAPDVDLGAIARGTPGFSGADLANLANEAAINAVRANREIITAEDFDAARDRIILGRREGSNVLLPEEKHAVAVHESGHALVAALSEHADPVAKVTILPAGQTLGVTEQLPLVERHMYSEDYLLDSLAVRLGGRAAELVALGQGSTGAANDLAGATDLAIKMVREFGLSKTLGPIGYPEGGSVFLGGGSSMSSRPFAEATQAEIDTEVSRMLRQAEERAVALLKDHRPQLDSLVNLLLEMETVDGAEVYRIVGRPDLSDTVPPVPPITTPPPRAAATTSADRPDSG